MIGPLTSQPTRHDRAGVARASAEARADLAAPLNSECFNRELSWLEF